MCAARCRTCAELGLWSELLTPPETVTTEEMLALVAELNARDDVDGILIQLPLPKHVDAKRAAGGGGSGEGCGWISSGECGAAAEQDSRRWRHARRRG